MGTKWAPSFVRIVDAMPVTATRKISTPGLRRESWTEADRVWMRERDGSYRPLDRPARAALGEEYRHHGRRPQGV